MNDPSRATLRDYLRMLRASRVAIAVLTVLCAAAAGTFSQAQTPVFLGEAQLSFQEENQSNAEAGVNAVQTQTAAQIAARGAASVLNEEVLQRVKQRLGSTAPVAELRDLAKAKVDDSDNLVTVEARSTDKHFAAALANEIARGTVDIQTRAVRRRFAQAADRVEAELRRLRRDEKGDDAALTISFFQRIASLRTLSVNATPVRLTKSASVPEVQASPKPLRNALLGGLIGLLLGVVAAFVRSSIDRRLRSSEEVEEHIDLPIVGSVRDTAFGHAPYLQNGRGPLSEQDLESFRILRTNLEFLDADHPPKSIVVTSPLPEEGKTTVSASLALAITAAGTRVLLVECDLRRPRLAERLGVEKGPGLSDCLGGRSTLPDVVQFVELFDGDATLGNGKRARSESGFPHKLAVVTAGSHSLRPAELLGSPRFRSFMEEATRTYEFVIVDTPPMLSVADTMEVAPLVEALLLCIRVEQTTRDQARAVGKILLRLPERPMAVVLTGIKRGHESDYGYYSYSNTDKR